MTNDAKIKSGQDEPRTCRECGKDARETTWGALLWSGICTTCFDSHWGAR